MIPSKKILILGSSSWLGSILLNQLDPKEYQIEATVYNTYLNFSDAIRLREAKILVDYISILKDFEPDIILNFLRGENEEGYQIHNEMVKYCEYDTNRHYIFCSSVLALDAYKEQDLTEDLLANASNEYGIFKANCERTLYDSKIHWTILRFSSLQGYCAHKFIRNEFLLNNLKEGKEIKVDLGVIQNRMFVNDAIDLIVKMIEIKQTGIIHLGTIDASDEIDFLRKQASLFGYDPNLILQGDRVRNVNLNCIPKTIHQMDARTLKFFEKDTLEKINRIVEYDKYRKL